MSDTASVSDSDTEDNGEPTQERTDPYSFGLDDLESPFSPDFGTDEDDPYSFWGDIPDF